MDRCKQRGRVQVQKVRHQAPTTGYDGPQWTESRAQKCHMNKCSKITMVKKKCSKILQVSFQKPVSGAFRYYVEYVCIHVTYMYVYTCIYVNTQCIGCFKCLHALLNLTTTTIAQHLDTCSCGDTLTVLRCSDSFFFFIECC